MLNANLG